MNRKRNFKKRIKVRLKYAGIILSRLFRSRLTVVMTAFCLAFSLLICRLFYLQIIKGEEYAREYELQIRKTKEIKSTRGNIYDRNGNLLAYSEMAYSITIEDPTSSADSVSERNRTINGILEQVLEIVEEHGDSVINSFGIILDSSGSYQFSQTSETQRLRFVADVYGYSSIDELSEEQQEKYTEEQEKVNAELEEKQAEIDNYDELIQAAAEAAAQEAQEQNSESEDSGDSSQTASASGNSQNSAGTSSGAASGGSTSGSSSSGSSSGTTSGDTSVAQTIVNAAYSQLGVPYVYGGTTPGVGLDCSELVQYCHSVAGISLPRTSQEQGGYRCSCEVNNLPLYSEKLSDILHEVS